MGTLDPFEWLMLTLTVLAVYGAYAMVNWLATGSCAG